ncbi:MAG: MliC family protein [Cardiobacteriaceae bacterium]|nr:MliC family protein [Cardiobacteriaceae bacterium]
MKPLFFLLPACVALSACVETHTHHHHQGGMSQPTHQHHAGHGHTHNHAMAGGGRFSCENGLSVNIKYLDADRLDIFMDDKHATLYRAPSASGDLFSDNLGLFNKLTEWHQRGNQASLTFVDPYGNRVDTACRK